MTHLKLTIMTLIWAGGFISGKMIATEAGPFTIAFMRFFLAASLLVIIVFWKKLDIRITIRQMAYAIGASFFGIFLYNYMFFTGINFIEAGRGAVIFSIEPIVVALGAVIFFKERLKFLKIIGILISITGAAIVVSNGKLIALLDGGIGRGEIYILLCVVSATIFTLFSKQLLQEVKPLVAIMYISLIGTATLFVPAMAEMNSAMVDIWTVKYVGNLFYLAFGPSVIAVLLYFEAFETIGMTRATQYLNLIPVFAVSLAVLFFGETLSLSLFVGGGLVTAGLYCANA